MKVLKRIVTKDRLINSIIPTLNNKIDSFYYCVDHFKGVFEFSFSKKSNCVYILDKNTLDEGTTFSDILLHIKRVNTNNLVFLISFKRITKSTDFFN